MNPLPLRIALVDSGVGGLSVLRALEKALPNESFLYVADTANYPYGTKSKEQLLECSKRIVDSLSLLPVKLILFACHTASTNALPHLVDHYPIPLLGIVEPTLSLIEKNQKIALLGSNATIRSNVYQERGKALFPSSQFYAVAGSPLVTAIESRAPSATIERIIHELFADISLEELDTILLVCTHFPLALRQISSCLPKTISILDPAAACAKQVEDQLKNSSLSIGKSASAPLFYTTGDPGSFLQAAPHFHNQVFSTNFLQKCDEIILK